ncbi:MAG: twin-arginine translocase subunit TatB [Desulfovibrio sp.]|nr:twin-arginine translocase subunit TatB [Desulfovibrio sp.]
MFGIGSTELLVILVVALIVLGPKSLASVSRSLGKAMGEFRRVSTDFRRAVNVEVAEQEARETRKATKPKEEHKPEQKPEEDSMPADSPLAQAIARAKAQAEGKPQDDAPKA